MAIPYSRMFFGLVPWYSLLIVSGILLAILLGEKEAVRRGLDKDTVIDTALIAVPCGIVGARLYYVAMTWEVFAKNPISILYIWEGGIAIYGAVIGGAIGVWLCARRKKLPFLQLCDVVVPGLLLAQAIGRWGNYFNMEAYGPVISDARFQFFPMGVLIPEGGSYVWHMATFFYESLWNALGFIALWRLRKSTRRHGDLFAWYLLIYGSGRFIIEQLRQDSLYIGSLRASQYLSLILCIAAMIWLLGRRNRPGLISALLLAARWFALESPWLYGILLAAGLALGVMSRPKGRISLMIAAAADGAGLMLSLLGVPFSAAFALGLHTVLCSLTLPLAVWALQRD